MSQQRLGACPALTSIRLRNFRNYRQLDLALDSKIIVLTGANGAGKTNCLEAISLFSPGRGLRRAALEDLNRSAHSGEAEGNWFAQCEFNHSDGPLQIATTRDENTGRRLVKLFDKPFKSASALASLFALIWLTPAMDRIFSEGAASRRRLLDRMVLTIQPDHASRVAAYERSLRERISALRGGKYDHAWLGVLEQRIAETAIAIAASRMTFTDAINPVLAEDHADLPRLRLDIDGETEKRLAASPAIDAENSLAQALKSARERDRQMGGASFGPHRSDLLVTDLETREPAARVSTGRQKSLLLALTLGEARLRQKRMGDLPIILLDEAAAHLDAERRTKLCKTIQDLGANVLLTGTDQYLFSALEQEALFLHVNNAHMCRIGDSR